jgi:hypothetical protein
LSFQNLCGGFPVIHDPRRPDILRKRDDLSGAALAGIAAAVVLFLGIAIYMLSSGNRDIAAVESPRLEQTTPAPSTTGQGTSMMPGRDQNVPNPSPPAAPGPKPQQR